MRWGTGKIRENIERRLKRLRSVKTWQLVVVLLFGVILSAIFLRINNLNMIELRQAVIEADHAGDQKAISESVSKLGRYVTKHINTDIGEFYLSASYDRAREEAVKAVANNSSVQGSELYQRASVECQTERFQVAGGYVQCVQNKVSSLGGPSQMETEAKMPPLQLYKISYATPFWSPDAAGFAVAFTAIILLMIIFRIIGVLWLKFLLKRQFRNV